MIELIRSVASNAIADLQASLLAFNDWQFFRVFAVLLILSVTMLLLPVGAWYPRTNFFTKSWLVDAHAQIHAMTSGAIASGLHRNVATGACSLAKCKPLNKLI